MFPETNNRTLEELAFCMFLFFLSSIFIECSFALFSYIVFEGEKVRQEQSERVEQEIQALDHDGPIMAGQTPALEKFGHDHQEIEHIDKI